MSLYTALVEAVSTGTSALTLIQLDPAADSTIRVVEIGISFTSVTSSDPPVLVELIRQSTAGTATSLTVVADQESDSKSPRVTARHTFTVEPTSGDVVRAWDVTPIGGLFVVQFPLGREPDALTSRIALRVTTSVAQTATAYITVDE